MASINQKDATSQTSPSVSLVGQGPRLRRKTTPKSVQKLCSRNMISKQVHVMERAWVKLNFMYHSLQSDYMKMRANHTSMAVIAKRLQDDVSSHERKIKKHQQSKVSLETKIEDLEVKIENLKEHVTILQEVRTKLQDKVNHFEKMIVDQADKMTTLIHDKRDYCSSSHAKETKIKKVKQLLNDIKIQLGPWGKFNHTQEDIDQLFEELDNYI